MPDPCITPMSHSYHISLTLKRIAGIVSNTEGNMSIYIVRRLFHQHKILFLQKTSRKRAKSKQKYSETPPSSDFLHPDVAALYTRMFGTTTPGCTESFHTD